MDKLDDIIQRKRPLQKGERLFESGDKLTSLYAVRSGSFKSYSISENGDEQITSFTLPGEVIGFDSMSDGIHQTVSQALETAMVCEIPFSTLDILADELPALRRQMMRLMSEEIKQDQQMFMLLNQRTAEERLAYFLRSLSLRFNQRGFSASEFRLTMTRSEIGNFLGLTVETISRLLSKFNKDGVITVEGKLIGILDSEALDQKSKTLSPQCG